MPLWVRSWTVWLVVGSSAPFFVYMSIMTYFIFSKFLEETLTYFCEKKAHIYLCIKYTLICVLLFHCYICGFFSLIYLCIYFTYIWVILNHTSRFLSFLFQIPFPKIIPGEKCFAFIQGVWDLFFLSFWNPVCV